MDFIATHLGDLYSIDDDQVELFRKNKYEDVYLKVNTLGGQDDVFFSSGVARILL